MGFDTINPCTGKLINSWSYHSDQDLASVLDQLALAQRSWRRETLPNKAKFLHALATHLRAKKEELVRLMAQEMGKPIKQGLAEVEKSASACEYFALKAEDFFSTETCNFSDKAAVIRKDSLGIIFGIMPWNFPVWQVIRFAAPALAAGNVVLLKHADMVAGTAELLEQVFRLSENSLQISSPIFRNLRLTHPQAAKVISNQRIRGLSFTGSSQAGRELASLAGRSLKKSVMELGGSDAYLVFADADIAAAAQLCAEARLINAGQSCVAAKRFLVHAGVMDKFMEHFKRVFQRIKTGDPLLSETEMGPLAAKKFQLELHQQVRNLIKEGAQVLLGAELPEGPGAFYPATVVRMPRNFQLHQEIFGPVACVWEFSEEKTAFQIANDSPYGLGAAIFTQSESIIKEAEQELECGLLAINDTVKSDARLPFGGVKDSGYGRELGLHGALEFTNLRTIYSAVNGRSL